MIKTLFLSTVVAQTPVQDENATLKGCAPAIRKMMTNAVARNFSESDRSIFRYVEYYDNGNVKNECIIEIGVPAK